MIRGVLGSRGGVGGVLGSGRGGAAAAWYLAGGVSAANCVAAYQAKGAASLAASYTNLANPGTYNAAPGVAPTFDTATGWTFNGSSQYLTTGVVPDATAQAWSMFIRFSNASGATNNYIAGCSDTVPNPDLVFFLISRPAASTVFFANGANTASYSSSATSGVLGFAGVTGYLNGSSVATIAAGGAANTRPSSIFMGANSFNASALAFFNGKIQAVAIYNVTLNAATVAAISAAMAAL